MRYLKELLSPDVQKAIHNALKKYQGASNNDLTEFYKARNREVERKQKEYDGLMHNMTNPNLPAEVVANMGKEMQRLLDEMAGLRDAQPPKDYTTDQIYT